MFSKTHLLRRNRNNATYRKFSIATMRGLFILMLVVSLLGASHSSGLAAGAIYYVDNTNASCTDASSNSGTNPATPLCTLERGAFKASVPGDTVRVIAGTYAETVYPNSGAAGSPITFLANPGVTVTGQPGTPSTPEVPGTNYPAFALSGKSYVVIDGFEITNTSGPGIYAELSDHITIQDNHITYAGAGSLFHPYEKGIVLKTTTNSTIDGNILDHNTCIGIRLLNGSDYNTISNNVSYSNFSGDVTDAAGIELYGASHNLVIHNITYDNQDSGINVYVNDFGVGSSYNLIIGNLSYGNGDHGIDHNNSPYNTLVGNTVHGNGTVGINFEGAPGTGSTNATVYNNIISQNGLTPPSSSFGGNLRIDSASIAGAVVDFNLYDRGDAAQQIVWNDTDYISLAAFRTAAPSQESHGLEGDPKFMSPVPPVLRSETDPFLSRALVGNYLLLAGSPAIDSANADAPGEPEKDLEGNDRIDDSGTGNTGFGIRTYDDRGAYEYQPVGDYAPIVSTQAATLVTSTTATLNGTVTNPGNPLATQHGFAYGTSPSPTISGTKTQLGAVSGVGTFTSNITSLTPGAVYHVRAYATNTVGTVYGEDVTFTMMNTTTTTVNCGAGTPVVTYGASITCVATVQAGSGSVTPTGNVNWTTGGSGSFQTSPCALSGTSGTATCSVSYRPTSVGSGSHLITASYVGDVTFLGSTGNQTVTVNKKAASVTPNAASKIYGSTDPALTGTLTGFLAGDNVNAVYSRTTGETVAGSPYAISAVLSPAGVLANYNITYNTANFTINKKNASVTPNAASKTIGEADPALTGTLTGFLAGDHVTATYSRTPGETVAGSPYTISAALSPTGVLANYNIIYHTASFTINPAKFFLPIILKVGP